MLGDVHAPAPLDVEVTQTLRGLLHGGKIALAPAELGREELGQLGVRRYPDVALPARAWELRNRCSTYDALYLALDEALDATLLTRDARLARAVDGLVDVATE
jgi:predicted nucleic acid-binding protein